MLSGIHRSLQDASHWAGREVDRHAEQAKRYLAMVTPQLKKNEATHGLLSGLEPPPRRGSWNYRFWLLLSDIRLFAHTAPRSLQSLRNLTYAAGRPGGLAMPNGLDCKVVIVAGQQALWLWPSTLREPKDTMLHVLYVHGGAFCLGTPETHKQLAGQLALRTQAAVLLPRYRRCPEHTIDDAVADVLAAYRWLEAEIATTESPEVAAADEAPIRLEPARSEGAKGIVLAGDSAGASLALSVALRLRSEGCQVSPAGLVLFSPWTDLWDSLERSSQSWEENAGIDFVLPDLAEYFTRLVLGAQLLKDEGGPHSSTAVWWLAKQAIAKTQRLDRATLREVALRPLLSPGRSAPLEGLPPTFVVTGACETLRDSQLHLVARLLEAKVDVDSLVYPDMPHAFPLANCAATQGCPAPSEAIDQAARFCRRAWNEEPLAPKVLRKGWSALGNAPPQPAIASC